ncbi:MAG TPA: FAD-binding oxidoreductase [Cellvibrionaceae bacterium]
MRNFQHICRYYRSILLGLFLGFFSLSAVAEKTWNDVSRLNAEAVARVVQITSESDVIEALQGVGLGGYITISGARHSQGGHIVYPGATVLDMTPFNRVLSISRADKTIIVQSGALWSDVQEAANKHGLSVRVMQSSNIFSIGGSLSANVHGRDPRHGPIIETVRRIKVALYNGEIVVASREQYSDLFYAVIGGYGLLGVVLEAEIELTDNLLLEKSTIPITAGSYGSHLVRGAEGLALHYSRCAIAKGPGFLKDCYAIDFYEAGKPGMIGELGEEKFVKRNAFLFGMSRKSNFGKYTRWWLQKQLVDVPGKIEIIGRNTAMRPPVEFLHYQSEHDTDILQEYFVPLSRFENFIGEAERILEKRDVNLLSVTLRYLEKNTESFLNYSNHDMISIVLYINIGLDKKSIAKAGKWTRELVDLSLENNGAYYLTYQKFPNIEQFQRAYPSWGKFLSVKCKYDPHEVFSNNFYEKYIRGSYLIIMGLSATDSKQSVCDHMLGNGAGSDKIVELPKFKTSR